MVLERGIKSNVCAWENGSLRPLRELIWGVSVILLGLLLVANGFDGRLGFIARPNSVTARYHVTEIY